MNTGRIYSNLDESIRPFLAGLLGNLVIAVLKLGLALLGGSRLVLMDGLFSFMASATFLIPWQAQVLERRTTDTRYPYGLGKILFISMAVVGLLGLIIATHMFYYSLMIMGRVRMYGLYAAAIMVTLISIITNEVLYRYLKERNQSCPNTMLTMSWRYNRIGAWISSFVLLLLILSYLGGAYLERIGVAIISVVVFFMALRMVFVGLAGIMDKVPAKRVMERIKACAQKIDQVREIVNLKARYVGTLLHIDIWITVDDDLDMNQADRIARRVKVRLMEKIPFAREVNVIIT